MSQPNPAPEMPPFVMMLQMLTAKWVTDSISACARLGVADQLEPGPRTAAEVAASIDANPDALYRLLRALASLGIFTELEDGRFAQTPLSDVLRTSARPSLRNMAMMFTDDWYARTWSEAAWSVKTGNPAPMKVFGKPFWDMFQERPDQAVNFNNAMNDMSQGDGPAVAAGYDFSRFQHIVDVGGGKGGLLAHILASTPNLRGTLLEIPSVAEQARTAPMLAPYLDRCTVEGGSFFERVTAGADAYIMKHIIHDWDDEKSTVIFRNIRKAIASDGIFLVVERIVEPRNEPGFTKLLDLEMLVTPGGRERSEEEWHSLFTRGGFRLDRVIPLASGQKILEASPA